MHGHLINVRNTLHRMCSTNIIANAGRHGGQMFSLNSPFKMRITNILNNQLIFILKICSNGSGSFEMKLSRRLCGPRLTHHLGRKLFRLNLNQKFKFKSNFKF